MGQQINQYTLDRTTFGDDDYYDIDYWDGATYQTAKIKGSVIKEGIKGIGMYSQTSASLPITNTTTETSLFDGATSVGTLQVLPAQFNIGDSFHCKIGGFVTCLNNSDITIRVVSNKGLAQESILVDTGLITLPTITNRVFEIEFDFTIRTLGNQTQASIITMGELNFLQNRDLSFEGSNFCVLNNTTFNSLIGNTLDVTWEWTTASASNSITTEIVNLRKTY